MQPDLPFTAGEWPRNNREDVRVRLDLFKDKVIVDCRTWWRDEAGELRPGRGGLTLSVRHLPALAEALDSRPRSCNGSGPSLGARCVSLTLRSPGAGVLAPACTTLAEIELGRPWAS